MKRLGKIIASVELLEKLLRLQKDVTISRVYQEIEDAETDTFCIIVHGPQLPLVHEGEAIPIVDISSTQGEER